MSDDPEKPIRKTVSLPAKTWREIEDFQFKHRIKRDTVAIRRLVEFALANRDQAAAETEPKSDKR